MRECHNICATFFVIYIYRFIGSYLRKKAASNTSSRVFETAIYYFFDPLLMLQSESLFFIIFGHFGRGIFYIRLLQKSTLLCRSSSFCQEELQDIPALVKAATVWWDR